MQSSFVGSRITGSSSPLGSGKCYAAYGVWLLSVASGCGPGVVDVGDLSNGDDAGAGAGGSSDLGAPDAGDPQGTGAAGCSIPNLGQYRLVFDSDDAKLERRIYSMRADGSELEPLTPVSELAREPAVSPDGSQLAYATPEGLKLLNLATGASELFLTDADQPSWSGDGSRLVHRISNGVGFQVLRMSDRGSEFIGGCSGCPYPVMTPDGTQVVTADVLFREGIEIQGAIKAYLWETDGSWSVREIVPGSPIRMAHPTPSPDGIWVAAAFQCAAGERSSLWVSPFAVSTPACEGRRTTRAGAANATNPSWGPGLLIAYERGEPPRDIAIVSADTGEECVIERPGDERNPSWASSVFDSPE